MFWVLTPWRWKHYVYPKRWYLRTSIHGVTTQIIIITLCVLVDWSTFLLIFFQKDVQQLQVPAGSPRCVPRGVGQRAGPSWVQVPDRPWSQAFKRQERRWRFLLGPSGLAESQGLCKRRRTPSVCLHKFTQWIPQVRYFVHLNRQTLFIVQNMIKHISTFPACPVFIFLFFPFARYLFVHHPFKFYVTDYKQDIWDSVLGKDTPCL